MRSRNTILLFILNLILSYLYGVHKAVVACIDTVNALHSPFAYWLSAISYEPSATCGLLLSVFCLLTSVLFRLWTMDYGLWTVDLAMSHQPSSPAALVAHEVVLLHHHHRHQRQPQPLLQLPRGCKARSSSSFSSSWEFQ